MPITSLPTPPTRSDPANFAIRADAFLAALPTFGTEANELAIEVNQNQSVASAAANTATAANTAATQTANAALWVSGQSYAAAANAIDGVDFKTYRRKTAGSSTTRPGLDPTNWVVLTTLGDVTLDGTQTITGAKTFTQTITGTITNANVAATLSDTSVYVPSGAVVHFARNTAPTGWLKANGAAVSRTTYSALFAAIGTTYGAGDGSTTFNLPDLRGEFLRGWDDARGADSGRTFGSFQGSANLSHDHTGTTSTNGNHNHNIAGNQGGATQILGTQSGSVAGIGPGTSGSYVNSYGGNVIIQAAGDHNHTFTTSASGSTESRPRNIALLACIKY